MRNFLGVDVRLFAILILSMLGQSNVFADDAAVIVDKFLTECTGSTWIEDVLETLVNAPNVKGPRCDIAQVKTELYTLIDTDYFQAAGASDVLFRSKAGSGNTVLGRLTGQNAGMLIGVYQGAERSQVLGIEVKSTVAVGRGFTEVSGVKE